MSLSALLVFLIPVRGLCSVPSVVVSIPPQGEFVKRLAGDKVRVEVLLPPGVNHETYEPTIGKLKALSGAKAFFKVGHPYFGVETNWLNQVLAGMPQLNIIDCSKGLELNHEDAHYWISPKKVAQMIPTLVSALENIVPDAAEEIRANAAGFKAELAALDNELAASLRPFSGEAFLVFHPAWGYFAKDYVLVQLAIEVEGKEPGVVRTREVINRARDAKVRTVFLEPGTPKASVDYLAQELSVRTQVIDPLAAGWFENLRHFRDCLLEDFKSRGQK